MPKVNSNYIYINFRLHEVAQRQIIISEAEMKYVGTFPFIFNLDFHFIYRWLFWPHVLKKRIQFDSRDCLFHFLRSFTSMISFFF